MIKFFEKNIHPNLYVDLYNIFYSYKIAIKFIIIGIFAIICELIAYKILINYYGIEKNFSTILSVTLSILIAFILNFKYNFKINKKYFFQSFLIFLLISILSWLVQNIFLKDLIFFNNYSQNRIFSAGIIFIIVYFLHFKLSFKFKTSVGIAIYVDNKEEIHKIFNSVKQFPDFIHVDIVDDTFINQPIKNLSYRIEVIRAYWTNKPIHVHIMSKYPSNWINEVSHFVDKIFIHHEISEDPIEIKQKYENKNLEICIATRHDSNFDLLKEKINYFNDCLILCIDNPGISGQNFNFNSLELIKKIKNFNSGIKICVDGGINKKTARNVSVDSIVSASYILKSNNPIEKILSLKYNF